MRKKLRWDGSKLATLKNAKGAKKTNNGNLPALVALWGSIGLGEQLLVMRILAHEMILMSAFMDPFLLSLLLNTNHDWP